MDVLILTAIVGCIYALGVLESWLRGEFDWPHVRREIALAATYWLLAVSKYLDQAAYAATSIA